MKKIFILLFGITFSFSALAQNNPEGNSNVTNRLPKNHNLEGGGEADNSGFGIKGGVNFNQLRGSDKSNLHDFSNKTTWHAGIYGQFQVRNSKFFSIQSEVLFNRHAFTSDSLDVKTDNLEVPLLFVFNVFDNVSVHVGPYAGVLLTVKENGVEKGGDVKSMMNSFNYGLAGGVEAKISFARIGARYNLGLNDIYKDPRVVDRLNHKVVSDLKNGAFQVYVGVGFQ